MRNTASRFLMSTAITGAVLVPAQAAFAQTGPTPAPPAAMAPTPQDGASPQEGQPDSGSYADIVVTARKQSETLKSVPASISVLTTEAIAAKDIRSGFDMNAIVPSLQVGYGQGGSSTPRIRGLGSNSAVFSIEPATAQYVDGVYGGHPRDLIIPLYDLDQIQVIKGTQSTLLGKNTTLGAILFTSKRPTDGFSYRASIDHEFRFNSTRFEGVLNLPLSDTLKLRVAGLYDRQNGYVYNYVYQDRESRRTFASGRAILAWNPTPAFDATLIYQHENYKENGQNLVLVRDNAANAITNIARGQGRTDFVIDQISSFNGSPQGRPRDHQKGDRATVIANYDIGGATITSQSAYVNWRVRFNSDLDFTPGNLAEFNVDQPNELFSQELRIATPKSNRVSVLAGIYYLWNKWGFNQNIDTYAPWARNGEVNHPYSQTLNAISGYADVNFSLTDKLKLDGGLRYTRETKDAEFSRTVLRPGNITAVFPAFPQFNATHKERNVDWSASVQYQFDPSNQIYFSAARGSKSGGFLTLPTNPRLAEFFGERALSFELGGKFRPARNLDFDVALFNTKVKDFQFNVSSPSGTIVQNVDVRTRGVEGTISWRPTPSLVISGGGAYVDARILEGFTGATAGTRIFRSPKWSGNLDVNWTAPISDALKLTVNPSVVAASRQYLQLPSSNAPEQDGYGLVNLRVALSKDDQGWEIAGLVKNLTSNRTLIFATPTFLFAGPFYGVRNPPATFVLSLKIKG